RRHPDDLGHPEPDGLGPPPRSDQLVNVFRRVDGRPRRVLVVEWCLVCGDGGQRQACRGGPQGDRPAGWVAEPGWGFGAGRPRRRGEVVVLPLRRERSGVATVTSPAAVVGDDCKTPPQFLWWDKGLACAECAHADYERRAIADPVVGDD